ncbi:hypothetical protein R5R35_012785 [Gryllus longicercus]|uniref:Sulfatase N-terminal domain-containing protein n=1 Tax=Gryllus longicercus TaxID=2509291 RepID=A0AAN9VK90_9ORTH
MLMPRRPDTLHLYDFNNYWRDFTGNFTTLPEYFKEHGYYTSSFGKVFHPGISSNWSDDQPYSWSAEPFHPPSQKYMNAAVCRGLDGKLHRNIVCPVEVEFQPGGTLPDVETLTAAVDFLHDVRNSSKNPFFLAVGFHKPHVPLKFPKQYINLHPLESVELPKARSYPSLLPTVAWNPWTDVRKREDVAALNVSFPFGPMPDSFARKIKQSYFAAVSYVDDLIGHLLNAVRENGYFDNTIIVLIGDHGWSMAEHGEWAKFSNFEIALRVPLLLYVPGQTDFKTSHLYKYTHVLTELVDIFPTLVELTNLSQSLPLCPENSKKIKLCTEGISLLPVIQNMQKKTNNATLNMDWKKAAFSQYPRPGIFPTMHPNSDKPHLRDIKVMGYSLRTWQYRYTEWVLFDNHNFIPRWANMIGAELYNHKLDPHENINMVNNKEMINIVQLLRAQLHAGWRYSLPKHLVKNIYN